MLYKEDVGTLISELRPKIKQAVTFLAHHNSKEIVKLENRKGKDAEKCKRKAETLRLEMVLLKSFIHKIQQDEAIKYALMLDFNQREKLLADMNLPLETKVMVKLATFKAVVSHLETFRVSHTDWQVKLPGIIKTLGIFSKNKKKVKKNIAKSERKLARKQQNSSVLSNESEDCVNSKVTSNRAPKKVGKKNQVMKTNGKEPESCEAEEDSKEGVSDDTDISDAENEDSEIGNDSKEETPTLKSKKQDNIKPPKKKKNTIISSGSEFAEVRRFADLQKKGTSVRKSETISTKQPSSNPSKSGPVEEDKFFMTGENEFFQTVFEKKGDESDKKWSTEGKKMEGNRRERRAQFTGRKLDASAGPKKIPRNDGRKSNGNNKNNVNNVSKLNKKKVGNKNTGNGVQSDEALHPSWAAKRAQKVSLDSFQGKKKKFDDNETNGKQVSSNKKTNGKQVSSSKKTNGKQVPSQTDETLHPSWAAKRSQKVSLGSFQGKKMKFNDN